VSWKDDANPEKPKKKDDEKKKKNNFFLSLALFRGVATRRCVLARCSLFARTAKRAHGEQRKLKSNLAEVFLNDKEKNRATAERDETDRGIVERSISRRLSLSAQHKLVR
jgi:hypothetical protein